MSADDLRRQGDTRVATWTLSGRLPTALLAVVQPDYTRLAVPGGAVYAPAWDTHDLRARYGPYVTALRDLAAFFGRPARPVAVAVVPESRGGRSVGRRSVTAWPWSRPTSWTERRRWRT